MQKKTKSISLLFLDSGKLYESGDTKALGEADLWLSNEKKIIDSLEESNFLYTKSKLECMAREKTKTKS